MPTFIKLHKWVGNRRIPSHGHGDPVWINAAMITQLMPFQGVVIEPNGPDSHAHRPRESVTSVYFPAATHEEVDGVSVIETPEQIIEKIKVAEVCQ